MAEERVRGRLAGILAADVAGPGIRYSGARFDWLRAGKQATVEAITVENSRSEFAKHISISVMDWRRCHHESCGLHIKLGDDEM